MPKFECVVLKKTTCTCAIFSEQSQIHRFCYCFSPKLPCIIATITNIRILLNGATLQKISITWEIKVQQGEEKGKKGKNWFFCVFFFLKKEKEKIWFEIIHSHNFLPLPILAILCSRVLARSFSSGFLFEVHSSVESVSKEMAGAWLGILLFLSRDMVEVACRTTLPRKECLSSSNSGLLSEYSSTCWTGSLLDLKHVQHAENNTLKI